MTVTVTVLSGPRNVTDCDRGRDPPRFKFDRHSHSGSHESLVTVNGAWPGMTLGTVLTSKRLQVGLRTSRSIIIRVTPRHCHGHTSSTSSMMASESCPAASDPQQL